jgi:hypothetical protein
MEHKCIITDSAYDIQYLLDKGWNVVSVTPQHVSAGTHNIGGKFCFILERLA